MKILFPLNSFYPTTIGGPGTVLYWHAVYLKKYGCDSVIITTTNGIKQEIVTDKFVDLACGKVYYSKKGTFSYNSFKVLCKEVAKADLIHLTSLFSPTSIVAFLVALLIGRNIKIVWSVRGEMNSNALRISSFKKKIFLIIYKAFSNKITFASTSAKETLEIKEHFRNSLVIEQSNVMPVPTRVPRNETKKRFLYLGRIHPIKNLESLILGFFRSEAFTDADVYLDIAGEYDERDMQYFSMLQALVSENGMKNKVSFLGHISGSAKEQLLANAYFLVLPSHTENFGNVVIESLGQATPVIASQNTPWQDLDTYNCGYWVKNSVESLSRAFDNSTELTAMDYSIYRDNSIKFVEENYNIDIQTQKWIDKYTNLLNNNNA